MSSKNPITIEALETLDAISRRGSFAKAAEELNKATSAVSYTVQKLEEQLGITLFQRLGRRSVLTPAGQLVLTEGREILASTMTLAKRAQELANGWEPKINIAFDSIHSYPQLFQALQGFLELHPSLEIDLSESVLNGGWEALEQGRVDLLVGAPGPVPQQKGYRSISMGTLNLAAVISAKHPQASLLVAASTRQAVLPHIRRVITHDTSVTDVRRSEGLSRDGNKFFVQNMDQKAEAIAAGIGIGHLPRQRVQALLDRGVLLEFEASNNNHESYLAWKISHKGKALQALVNCLSAIE